MASVSAVSAVAERLDYFLLAEGAPARCIGGLRDGVVQLQLELRGIVRAANSIDSMSEVLKKNVGQLAYYIEDAVESYARREAEHQGKSGVSRYLSNFSSTTARRLREDVHIFTSRIPDIKYDMGAGGGGSSSSSTAQQPREQLAEHQGKSGVSRSLFNFSSTTARRLKEDVHIFTRRIRDIKNDMGAGGGGSSSSSIAQQPCEQLVPDETTHHVKDDKERLIDDKEWLISHLVDEPPHLTIIAIHGMGGIGKATLARSSFDYPLVEDRFDFRAWTCVSQEFDARNVLKDIFSSTQATSIDKIAGMETMELKELLYKSLKGRSYLVVLDDVWSTEVWDSLKVAFPNDHDGSRIVITTRSLDVANSSARYVRTMQLLSGQDSWELLKEKLKDRGNELDPDTERIGKDIVKQCGGLPLAIATIGVVLRGMNCSDWGQAIPVEKLYLLWMAEGLISVRDPIDKWKMEVAEDYLEKLVYRSLVIVEEMEPLLSYVRFKSCQVHDLIREVCIQKGKQDEFFEIIDFGDVKKWRSLSHRLAIYLHKYREKDDLLEIPAEARHIIRSILFFDTNNKSPSSSTWPKELSGLKDFQRTRLLDFDKVDFRDRLTYLRYLSFGGCYLSKFPVSLSNFPLLETLDLRVTNSCIVTIPNVLRKLSNLRYLYFPLAYQSDADGKLKLDSLKKLEILENFHADRCEADDLRELIKLEVFMGTVEGNNEDLEKTVSSLNGMKSLRHSSLVVKAFDAYSKQRRSIVAELLDCNAIHILDMEGYLGVFPYPDKAIGSNFTEMIFYGSEFSEDSDLMPILGKLSNLRSLVLCNDAFIGKKLTFSEGFPSLTSLKLATLQFLENLEVEGETMLGIAFFTVERCNKLEMFPYALIYRGCFQKLMVGSMPEGFRNKAKELVEKLKYDSGKEDVTVTFYDCP